LPLPLQLSSNAIAFPLLIACGRFWLSRNQWVQGGKPYWLAIHSNQSRGIQ
jgi:hypothetical protein